MEEKETLKATCQPDYEREYHRLIKENSQLMSENDVSECVRACTEKAVQGNVLL